MLIIILLQNINNMKEFEQFKRQQIKRGGLKLPQSFVRPVSLQKIRESSIAKSKQLDKQSVQQKQNHPPKSKKEQNITYEKILEKKLGKPDSTSISENRSKIKFLKLEERTDRLHEEHNLRQQKKILKQKQYQQIKLKECTFKPKILNQTQSKRSLKQFLDFQKAHCTRKAEKIQNLKHEIMKNQEQIATFRPQVTKRNLTNNISNDNQNVHQRLFEMAKLKIQKEKMEKEKQLIIQEEAKNRKISNQSERGTSKQLRKAPSIKSIVRNNTEKSREESVKKGQVTPKNSNNIKYVILKIIKEILQSCEHLNIQSHKISYLQFSDLMFAMRFVKAQGSTNYAERKHLYDIWNLLRGDVNQYIDLHSFSKVVLSILGIHDMKTAQRILQECPYDIFRMHQKAQTDRNGSEKSYGCFLESEAAVIDEKQSKRIHREFQILYTIRLNSESKKNVDSHLPTFKPEILENSKDMAEKFRNKLLEETTEMLKNKQIEFNIPANGEINHVDLLMLQKKASEAKIRRHRQQKEVIEEEKHNQSTRKSIQSTNSLRYLDLYALSTSNKYQKRDRTADQIDAERYKDELTFKPNINHEQINHWQPIAKDIDKTVFRMIEARKMKQTDKGDKRKSKQKEKVQEQRTPILYLNVGVDNNHIERLSIFQGDDPTQLAEDFAVKFKLGNNAKQRLAKLIKNQVQQVLWNIEQVDEN